MAENYIVFDIGGTSIKYALMNDKAEFLMKDSFVTRREDAQLVLKDVADTVNKYKDEYQLKGIAMSIPGSINVETGYVGFMSAIKGLTNINVKEYMLEHTGLEAEMDNDANCATMAEQWQGGGRGIADFCCFTIGTGIGGGMVINHRIHRGHKYMAGEFGVMLTQGIGREPFGANWWSALGATSMLVKRASEASGEELDGEEIFRRAQSGDAICAKEVNDFYMANAIGIFDLVYSINPEKILIGGGVSAQGDALIKGIEDKLREIYPDVLDLVTIETCQLKNDAGMIGALFNYLQRHGLVA
ncbi:ROK family protein [Culicoidibacter larvae]|uniref:ROK family protein n=1 Tax=Culicoidibacter larvae TaxID=2579976 RepID=A0A5R8QHB9_9FIRM|nr:ROK family protein [Culicoidibacter larvae]TLG77090.1 ROK family protein [Culicoidibacter larvae]